ncbi:MAG TPA: esterase [Beijerinckiaceae bacterium]|nr:esterase [Beijerinckiaceae bacterium]
MRHLLTASAICLASLSIASIQSHAQTKEPLALRDMGSFHLGGRLVTISGEPTRDVPLPNGQTQHVDNNGTYLVEQMYVQYFLPQAKHGKYPLLMWHGGGLTGVTYESTPDGREGFLNMFVRKGWDTYVSDSVERGRAGWAPPEVFKGEPVFTPLGFPWETYRIGAPGSFNVDPAKRVTYPGSQFPVEGYDNLVRQMVPRWLTTDDAIMKAYLDEVDRVCPCVLLVHSQSGTIGYRAAIARPDKIKALVDIEGTLRGDATTAATVKNIPILALYGDNVDKSKMFSDQHATNLKMVDIAKSVGGDVEVVNLPDLGIHGNSHFMMMEKNNAQVADVIAKWLADKGLTE